MSSSTWAAIPWSLVPKGGSDPGSSTAIGWYKHRVPYLPSATYLQTLDIWIPGDSSAPNAEDVLPVREGAWIVYIHGGAWRDPLVDSSSFERTAMNLLHAAQSTDRFPIAGIASINYRLSAHPNYPTDSSTPEETIAARTAKHPEHIQDVLTALAYLQSVGGAVDSFILAGHSCGATLAFQVAMNPLRWGFEAAKLPRKPQVLVGLNGLYDLARFIKDPDASHAHLKSLYEAFTCGAFGDDQNTWIDVCPTVVENWSTEWPEGERIVLVQSRDDSLVPYSQLEIMRTHLKGSVGSNISIQELPATLDHNDLWKQGDELSDILKQVVSESKT